MTIKELSEKYDIELVTAGANKGKLFIPRPPKDASVLEEIKEKREKIIEFILLREKEEKEAFERRNQLISQIEGLAEITNAREALAEWQAAFNRSFRDVGGLGVGPKPEYDFEESYARYPRAAAYLKAKKEADKSNYEIASIGKKALEEVIFGDYEKAMREMEEELSKFTERHAWD